ncbi:hypothetical protein LRB59_05520 [Borreliella burgdorferi]|uniref:Uncharacterized protein n=2 Tax=Borreliella TaxID=64895 RepID=Q9S020_BORBU|nr:MULTISPECIES: plasmid maintenance protein [Borreliella]AAF08550.2 conserved hypothetical protein [Borreliella burgdorferi B31]ACN55797.1 conserved hypothetical protein [Borreliella burgdorferi WI91-23]APT00454.1 hypothetical protein Bmayo_05230 [Borreliella mayonii]MCD2331510.1 hypothetical protein [Borreliella burgdorferi]MCD2408854.1 hypothetical protein [Borreliella burgdorferi]
MYKAIKEQQEIEIDHACRILILTATIFEINSIFENYYQKTLLKKYNENLKNKNLPPSNISTMKKYLNQLEKEIKIIAKFYFKNDQSLIYCKLNYTLEKICLKLIKFYKKFYKELKQFTQKNITT